LRLNFSLPEQHPAPSCPREALQTLHVADAIGASIIAAVRLARVPDLEMNIPEVMGVVKQSVLLARTILDEALRLF